MKIKEAGKRLGLTLAAIATLSMTACGVSNSAAPVIIQEEPETVMQEVNETLPEETNEEQNVVRAISETVYERFPDADFIEQISAEKYVVLYRSDTHISAEVKIYDVTKDKVMKSFKVYSDDWFVKPVIYMDQGFGFISERGGVKNHGVDAVFYDIDGNLVNRFSKDFDMNLFSSYTFAPDGSAFYVSLNDNEMCACGYSFKTDYTTKIIAVYGDGSEELIKEFDSHTDLSFLGTTPDGKIVVRYQYDPNEKELHTHEEFEREWMLIGENEGKEKVERGFALLDPKAGDEQELEKIYQYDGYFTEVVLRGDSIITADSNEIRKICPDENGVYQEIKYETEIGAEGYSFELYVSANGEFVAYPTYTDGFMDTTVNVLQFENGSADLAYSEFFEGKNIEFKQNYTISMLDEATGDLYGIYNETAEGGLRNQIFYVNIFE